MWGDWYGGVTDSEGDDSVCNVRVFGKVDSATTDDFGEEVSTS